LNEHDLQNQIRLAVGKEQAATLFRANVGGGWTGDVVSRSQGRVVLANARRFSTGLPAGFPDLFGFKTIEIGERKIAAFAFVEVKTPCGRASEKQKHLHDFLQGAGAIGGVARSPEEALKILSWA